MVHDAAPPRLSRRRFIHLVGRAGGYAAAYSTMVAMGLLPVPDAYAGPPQLPARSGRGTRVVIVGAGIAGLTAAYELGKAGYACTVLEARNRAGGRNWTLRAGDRIEEIDSVQRVAWERAEHIYFNAGPARLPHHHTAVLGYCKAFGIPLEVFVNDDRNAFLHDDATFGGKPVRSRQVRGDIRGHLAELIAKAVNKGALDEALAGTDKEKLLLFVRGFGALRADLVYRGSPKAGYAVPPGAGNALGKINEPLALQSLVQKTFWDETSSFGDEYEQSATMFQPVGGMDRIVAAFVKRVGRAIRYNAAVSQIRRAGDGVRVVYHDTAARKDKAIDAAFAVITTPLTVLRDMDTDFSPRHKEAMKAGDYVPAAKVAFQARRRFWEEDDQIYGGISWTTQDVTQLWYPSSNFHGRNGIMLGAYIWSNDIGDSFAKLAPPDRIALALAQGEKLHPNYQNDVDRGVAVAWSKIPFTRGAWCEWSEDARKTAYSVLNEPDGPLLLAGEHLSHIPGWQEGAVLSAHRAVAAIAARVATRRK